jgi:flagellar motor switch protein FliN/FliY
MDENEQNTSLETQTVDANVSPTASPPPAAAPQGAASLDLVIDLPVRVTVEVGRTKLLLREVLEVGNGSVLELDRGTSEPADILVNGQLIAKGDLTSVDDRLAVRIVELIQSGVPTGRTD